jgi:FlgD Ig-like domain
MKRCVLILALLAMAAPALAVWPPAIRLTDGPNQNINPAVSYHVGFGSIDTVCLTWQRSHSNGWDIYFSYTLTQFTWAVPNQLTSLPDSNITPAVSGYFGRWTCSWVNCHGDSQNILLSRRLHSPWSTPQYISQDTFPNTEPTVWQSEAHDTVWVAWASYRGGFWNLYSKCYDGAGWSPEIPIIENWGENRKPSLALLFISSLGVLWQNFGSGNWNIYWSQFRAGAWLPPQAISRGSFMNIDPFPVAWWGGKNTTLFAGDTFGNMEVFSARIDSPQFKQRMTTNDSLDVEPKGLSYAVPSEADTTKRPWPPIFSAWTSSRDGNRNIYAKLLIEDVVDTNRADDRHPVITALPWDSYVVHWVVWQSNRDGNWNIYASNRAIQVGVSTREIETLLPETDSKLLGSPIRPPGSLILLMPSTAPHTYLRFYDLRGCCIGVRKAERNAQGRYELTWDGRDASGKPLPSGLYFLRAEGVPNLFRLVLLR